MPKKPTSVSEYHVTNSLKPIVGDDEGAIDLMNVTPYGLSISINTTDLT
jgi:hypothetical protein